MKKKLIYEGKTKDVYILNDGKVRLEFKDTVTGKNGKFDPGENQVGLEIPEMGSYSLKVSILFFNMIKEQGISTHMISANVENNTMDVKNVIPLPIECICRLVATGSLIRRYGKFVKEGKVLNYLFEITVKDDERGDPMINEDQLIAFELLQEGQYQKLKELTQDITCLIKKFLEKKDIALYDIKLEFGLDVNNEIILIDEISAGSMRCYKNGKKLDPIELSKLILE